MRRFVLCVGVGLAAAGCAAASGADCQEGKPARGNVRGTVFDPDDKTIESVEVVSLSGASSIATNSVGEFLLPDLPAGSNCLFVRRLGYGPVSFCVLVPRDSTIWLAIHMLRSATKLPDVVRTEKFSERLEEVGFSRRQRNLKGFFLTRTDIDQSGSSRVSHLLQRVARVTIRQMGPRGSLVTTGIAGNCVMRVIVDGTPLRIDERPPFRFLLDAFIDPAMVEAIEVYTGASDTPIEFAQLVNTCGTIVIWTRK